jgi:hypothetical protein
LDAAENQRDDQELPSEPANMAIVSGRQKEHSRLLRHRVDNNQRSKHLESGNAMAELEAFKLTWRCVRSVRKGFFRCLFLDFLDVGFALCYAVSQYRYLFLPGRILIPTTYTVPRLGHYQYHGEQSCVLQPTLIRGSKNCCSIT